VLAAAVDRAGSIAEAISHVQLPAPKRSAMKKLGKIAGHVGVEIHLYTSWPTRRGGVCRALFTRTRIGIRGTDLTSYRWISGPGSIEKLEAEPGLMLSPFHAPPSLTPGIS